jgi:hypothetical protein
LTDVILTAVHRLVREDGLFVSPWPRQRTRPFDAKARFGRMSPAVGAVN